MKPTERCSKALEIEVPDTPGHVDEVIVLQCTKKTGHKGQHRTADQSLFWTE